jgi:hypothetical protein
MDEYEVELIDYLRVIWRGKWIILASLVIALVVTAGIMWTRPNEYAGTVTYRLYESLSRLLVPTTPAETVEIGSIRSIFPGTQKLIYAIDAIDTSSLEEGITLKVEASDDLVQVTLSGTVPIGSLVDGIDRLTMRLHEQLTEHLDAERSRTITEKELKIEQMARQRTLLEDRMAAIISPDDPRLPYLAEKIIDLEALLIEEQVTFETLQQTAVADLFTLETVGRSMIAKIGPTFKTLLPMYTPLLFPVTVHPVMMRFSTPCTSIPKLPLLRTTQFSTRNSLISPRGPIT